MSKSKNYFGAFVVAFIVILFPLGSLLVNLYGAKNGKQNYAELKKNFGIMPAFSQNDIHGKLQTSTDVHGEVILFSKLENSSSDSIISVLRVINKTEQFREETDNFRLITFYDSLNTEKAHQLDLQISALDKERWLLIPMNDAIKKMTLPNESTVALIDTAGIIRHYYDTQLLSDKRLLVQHLVWMPIKKKKDVIKVEQKKM